MVSVRILNSFKHEHAAENTNLAVNLISGNDDLFVIQLIPLCENVSGDFVQLSWLRILVEIRIILCELDTVHHREQFMYGKKQTILKKKNLNYF